MGEIITIAGNPGCGEIGEDTVYLLESIERAFQIRFTREDAIPATVGGLCELVKSRMQGDKTSRCMSSWVFYRLRRAILAATGGSRQSVAPTTELASLLSKGRERRRQWEAIEASLELHLPKLTFSYPVEWLLSIAHFAAAMSVVVLLLPKLKLDIPNWIGMICITAFAALVLWVIVRAKLQPLATRLPHNCQTTGDLVKRIVAINYGALANRAGWNDRELWRALKDFIAGEVFIDADQITPETAFPDGLDIV